MFHKDQATPWCFCFLGDGPVGAIIRSFLHTHIIAMYTCIAVGNIRAPVDILWNI